MHQAPRGGAKKKPPCGGYEAARQAFGLGLGASPTWLRPCCAGPYTALAGRSEYGGSAPLTDPPAPPLRFLVARRCLLVDDLHLEGRRRFLEG